MPPMNSAPVAETLRTFSRDTMSEGEPRRTTCVEIHGQTYAVATRGPLTIVGLEDDWYDDVRDPHAVIETLKRASGIKADLFTFRQRLPELAPKHPYPMEWEELAVLPIKSYQDWWNHQIKSRVRNQIRKSEKEGVEVREVTFDDEFVRGMTAIFNEAPVRQGRRFWHYGKDFDTVKQQFSRCLFREDVIGAYYRNELIGFVMLGNAGCFGITGQILSSIPHRDKATNNALIAKSVELCEKKGLSYLVYLYWSDDSLAEFKRRCGFEKTTAPRYFVPLTRLGSLGLKVGLHRGWKGMLPPRVKGSLKRLRRAWYSRRED